MIILTKVNKNNTDESYDKKIYINPTNIQWVESVELGTLIVLVKDSIIVRETIDTVIKKLK